MARILLMINPRSRSGASASSEVETLLCSQGHLIIKPEDDESRADPNGLVLKRRNEIDFVMVGGGDGSVNFLLPSLVESKLPLLLIPLGTANNLARTYKLPTRYPEIFGLIERGKILEVDLGLVNGIYFVNVAGLGLSTEVNTNVSPVLKRFLGVGAFILTAAKMAFKMNPFRASIETNRKTPLLSHSWQISVCNGKFYGNGLTIKPTARLTDGKLHLLSTEVSNLWSAFRLIPSLLSGEFKKEHEVTLLSAEKILVKTRRTFHIDVDGDVKTTTPAEFSVVPKALRLVVPEAESEMKSR